MQKQYRFFRFICLLLFLVFIVKMAGAQTYYVASSKDGYTVHYTIEDSAAESVRNLYIGATYFCLEPGGGMRVGYVANGDYLLKNKILFSASFQRCYAPSALDIEYSNVAWEEQKYYKVFSNINTNISYYFSGHKKLKMDYVVVNNASSTGKIQYRLNVPSVKARNFGIKGGINRVQQTVNYWLSDTVDVGYISSSSLFLGGEIAFWNYVKVNIKESGIRTFNSLSLIYAGVLFAPAMDYSFVNTDGEDLKIYDHSEIKGMPAIPFGFKVGLDMRQNVYFNRLCRTIGLEFGSRPTVGKVKMFYFQLKLGINFMAKV